jgi:hypothetical protein
LRKQLRNQIRPGKPFPTHSANAVAFKKEFIFLLLTPPKGVPGRLILFEALFKKN